MQQVEMAEAFAGHSLRKIRLFGGHPALLERTSLIMKNTVGLPGDARPTPLISLQYGKSEFYLHFFR